MSERLVKYKDEILRIISQNDVSIISAPTGTGKSSKIPQWLAVDNLRVIVTQPRRIVCSNLAKFVAKDFGCKVGEQVGQAMAGDTNIKSWTSIVFATTGTFVKILTKDKDKFPYDYIILDECHTRDLHMDMCLLLVKAFFSKFKHWKPRIILLSATMDMDMMSSHFSNVDGRELKIGKFQVKEAQTPYPIEQYFIEDIRKGIEVMDLKSIIKMDGLTNPLDYKGKLRIDHRGLPENLVLIPELLRQISKLDDDKLGSRDVIIFLPGIYEIRSLVNYINIFDKKDKDWVLLEAFANQQQDILDVIKEPLQFPKRKIIISTNLCESSLTIPNIGYVIDLCLTRRLEFDTTVGFNRMATSVASTSQCIQRGGRTGRTNRGIHFILTEKIFFNSKMSLHADPEIKLCWLGTVILLLKSLDMGPPKSILNFAVTRPDDDAFISTVKILKQSQALTIRMDDGSYKEDDGELTFFGTLAWELGIDIRQVRMIMFSILFDHFNYGVLMAAISVSRPVFTTHPDGDKSVDLWIQKKQLGELVQSDILTTMSVCIKFMNNPQVLDEFGIRSGVCAQILNDTQTIFRKMKLHLQIELPDGYDDYRDFDQFTNQGVLHRKLFILKFIIGAAAYPNVFQKPKVRNKKKGVVAKRVYEECMQYCPLSTVLLRYHDPITPVSEILASECILYLKKELTFDGIIPMIKWNSNYKCFACAYPSDTRKINGVPISVFKALKLKNMNKKLEFENNGRVFTLDGPFSSINMKFENSFIPFIRKSDKREREIKFDRESVNCYLLDSKFENPRDCCISSLIMTITRNGQLVAKDLTMMPYITGFNEKLHLFLSPKAQLVKESQSANFDYYFGAKVGLGAENCEKDGLHDIFVNRDACIQFSAVINSNHLSRINKLRQRMSTIWSRERSMIFEPVPRDMKEEILNLFKEQCQPMEKFYKQNLQKLDINWDLEKETNLSMDLFPQHISFSYV